jgi:hypothetical protein
LDLAGWPALLAVGGCVPLTAPPKNGPTGVFIPDINRKKGTAIGLQWVIRSRSRPLLFVLAPRSVIGREAPELLVSSCPISIGREAKLLVFHPRDQSEGLLGAVGCARTRPGHSVFGWATRPGYFFPCVNGGAMRPGYFPPPAPRWRLSLGDETRFLFFLSR